jgi:lysophospholipase L1-like esterase
MTKRVLCYGDSNTWGHIPETGGRYGADVRWPGVLQRELGGGFIVIEEGLCGRTTVWDDPIEGYKNGRQYLIPCLASHKPLDLVVILLGTNDLKHRFSLTAYDIAEGAGVLVDLVHASQVGPDNGRPTVLLLAPPPVSTLSDYADMFRGAVAESQRLAAQFARVAQLKGCALLDVDAILSCSPVDGIHFDPAGHLALGQAVAQRVRALLS